MVAPGLSGGTIMQGSDRSRPTHPHIGSQLEAVPHPADNAAPRTSSGLNKASLFYEAVFQCELAAYILEVRNDGRMTFADANDLVAKIANLPLPQILGKTPLECLPTEVAQCLEANPDNVCNRRAQSPTNGPWSFRADG